jgi:hypothetical protein
MPNREKIVATGSEANQRKPSRWFWGQTTDKPSQWFWCQNTHKPSTVVLRLNQKTHAPRLHVHSADRAGCHPSSRSSGHRVPDLCDYPRSSVTGLLLLPRSSSLPAMPHLSPAHHKISKHDSPNETKIKVKPSKLSRIQIQTSASQWLIIIKPRNWPLGFSENPIPIRDDCC